MDCSTPDFPVRLGQMERHIMLLALHINLFQLHSGNRFIFSWIQFSSVAQSCLTSCDPYSTWGFPVPSPTPGACLNSYPLSRWCHPAISYSFVPFSSCLQSYPASGSFIVSQFFTSGGQSIGVSASASVLPMNIQGWFPLGSTGLISCCPRNSQESSPAPQFRSISSLVLSFLYGPTLISIHDYWKNRQFSSVQSLSHVWLFVTPWTAACQAFLSITNSWSLLKLMSIDLVMPSNHLILCHPLLLPPSIFPSIRVFLDESVLHIRWCKYWSFSFSISPSSEYSGLISFRMDWLDLLASPRDSQESSPTPQFKNINSSALSFLYSPTLTSIHDYSKSHSFAIWTFLGKVVSLLFDMLSRLVLAFLPRSKNLLISWLQSPSAVILEPKNIVLSLFPLFPHLLTMKWWDQMPWS